MIKILWVGDGGVSSGFARVNHSIINNLPKDEFEVHHLAVNYRGDPHPDASKFMYSATAENPNDYLGFGRVPKLLKKLEPDILFILNDPWVIYEYLKFVPVGTKVVGYTPVDAKPLQHEWAAVLNKMSQLITYTEFGRQAFLEAYPEFHDIKVIQHGIDRDRFYPVDQQEARELLGEGVPQNGFIVFNGNRNQPRKRIDLTIKAFAEFAKDKDDVFLYLHMGQQDMGWDVIKLATRYGLKPGQLIMTSKDVSPANFVSDETLNLIYNACDVGINTSQGEGWGLVSFEQGVCGVPQIVPNSAATAEIYPDDTVLKIDISHYDPYPQMLTEGAVVSLEHTVQCLNTYYYDIELRKQHGENLRNLILQPRFDWENVAAEFAEVFRGVNG